MSKRFDRKIVWITGGGSGLGKALALEFAGRGAHVAVSGRRKARLDETVAEVEDLGQQGLAVVCDVTDDEAVRSAVDQVVATFGRLDVSVANAGFGVSGRVDQVPAEQWRHQFDVNVVGVASTIRWSMPHLYETNGRMVLMGSAGGAIASPNVGPYHASKYAVRAIGQVLSMEIAGSGASCTTLQPGFVESEITKVDNEGELHPDWEDRRPQQLIWPADRAAATMVDAVYRREREYTFTIHGRIGAFLGKHMPGLVHFAMSRAAGGYIPESDDS